MEKKGFTKEDFLMYHPSGKLGKGLTYKVCDLMITGERMPLVDIKMSFPEVISKISEYKLGMAMILDENKKLIGVLTDGDIRRTLLKYPTSIPALKDVMTVNPKTIKSDAYAASALNLMEKYSITALAVVDENNYPVGVIHVHDLLRAGVA
jgi:arabinose-5-phosphate isomerase